MRKTGLLALLISLSGTAATIKIPEYKYSVRDIVEKKLTKERLYEQMNMRLVRTSDSICSNRAHVWAYNFKMHEIDSPKIFLFFTRKTGRFQGTAWWYHVSPLINEKGKLFVMDRGFPGRISRPLSVQEWLKEFNGINSVCKEIKSRDEDLIRLMFKEKAFPEKTEHGQFNCYYKITPPGYWTPGHLAKNLLGEDEDGKPVRVVRDEFEEEEVFQACRETSTTPLGWFGRQNLDECRSFVEHGSQNFTSVY